MKKLNPNLPEGLETPRDIRKTLRLALEEETPLSRLQFADGQLEQFDCAKVEFQKCSFESCSFLSCSFQGASFEDVLFLGCNFSNSDFTDAYFERCRFVGCKCVGLHLSGSIIKHSSLEESNFQYSYLDRAKLTDVLLQDLDFTEVSLMEGTLKRLETHRTKFIKNNFFHTMLAGIDFTDCELLAPTVSAPPEELRGIKINILQAADLVGLWGITVDR